MRGKKEKQGRKGAQRRIEKEKKSRELEGNKKEKKRKHRREEKEENIRKTKKKRRTITFPSLSLCLSLHHKPLPIATTPPPWATVIDSITTAKSTLLLLHLLLLLRAPSTVLQVNSGELLHCLLGHTKMVGSSPTQSHKKISTGLTSTQHYFGPISTQFLLGWFWPSQDGFSPYIWASPSYYIFIILYKKTQLL